MKIIKFESENVKRLKAVSITPEGSVIIIGGKNGQGKSSCLDAIRWALEGKKVMDPKPIRTGQKGARTVLHLGDNGIPQLKVTQTISPSGERLTVENVEGMVYKTPQAILDKLRGMIGFDPLEFSRMDGKKQGETLRGLVGLDFSEMDRKRKEYFDERTMVNREVKGLQVKIDSIPEHEAPAEEIVISDLTGEMERRMNVNSANEERRRNLKDLRNQYESLKENTEIQREHIAELERNLVNAKESLANFEKALVQKNDCLVITENGVAGLQDLEIEPIKDEITKAENTNMLIRANKEHARMLLQLDEKKKEADSLTAEIESIDQSKVQILEKTSFPIPGLGFDENGVTYNGLPFEQCGSAEQLRVSVAMGIAMNKNLRVLLIRDGSLLDSENLELVAQMAEESGSQVWIERVGEGKEASVVIVDGEVSNK